MGSANLHNHEAALRRAIAELDKRAATGERGKSIADLARQVRDLAELLTEDIAQFPDTADLDKLRQAASLIIERAAALERELKGRGAPN